MGRRPPARAPSSWEPAADPRRSGEAPASRPGNHARWPPSRLERPRLPGEEADLPGSPPEALIPKMHLEAAGIYEFGRDFGGEFGGELIPFRGYWGEFGKPYKLFARRLIPSGKYWGDINPIGKVLGRVWGRANSIGRVLGRARTLYKLFPALLPRTLPQTCICSLFPASSR